MKIDFKELSRIKLEVSKENKCKVKKIIKIVIDSKLEEKKEIKQIVDSYLSI